MEAAKRLGISVDPFLFATPDEEASTVCRRLQAAASNLGVKEMQFRIESLRGLDALRDQPEG